MKFEGIFLVAAYLLSFSHAIILLGNERVTSLNQIRQFFEINDDRHRDLNLGQIEKEEFQELRDWFWTNLTKAQVDQLRGRTFADGSTLGDLVDDDEWLGFYEGNWQYDPQVLELSQQVDLASMTRDQFDLYGQRIHNLPWTTMCGLFKHTVQVQARKSVAGERAHLSLWFLLSLSPVKLYKCRLEGLLAYSTEMNAFLQSICLSSSPAAATSNPQIRAALSIPAQMWRMREPITHLVARSLMEVAKPLKIGTDRILRYRLHQFAQGMVHLLDNPERTYATEWNLVMLVKEAREKIDSLPALRQRAVQELTSNQTKVYKLPESAITRYGYAILRWNDDSACTVLENLASKNAKGANGIPDALVLLFSPASIFRCYHGGNRKIILGEIFLRSMLFGNATVPEGVIKQKFRIYLQHLLQSSASLDGLQGILSNDIGLLHQHSSKSILSWRLKQFSLGLEQQSQLPTEEQILGQLEIVQKIANLVRDEAALIKTFWNAAKQAASIETILTINSLHLDTMGSLYQRLFNSYPALLQTPLARLGFSPARLLIQGCFEGNPAGLMDLLFLNGNSVSQEVYASLFEKIVKLNNSLIDFGLWRALYDEITPLIASSSLLSLRMFQLFRTVIEATSAGVNDAVPVEQEILKRLIPLYIQ